MDTDIVILGNRYKFVDSHSLVCKFGVTIQEGDNIQEEGT